MERYRPGASGRNGEEEESATDQVGDRSKETKKPTEEGRTTLPGYLKPDHAIGERAMTGDLEVEIIE